MMYLISPVIRICIKYDGLQNMSLTVKNLDLWVSDKVGLKQTHAATQVGQMQKVLNIETRGKQQRY